MLGWRAWIVVTLGVLLGYAGHSLAKKTLAAFPAITDRVRAKSAHKKRGKYGLFPTAFLPTEPNTAAYLLGFCIKTFDPRDVHHR